MDSEKYRLDSLRPLMNGSVCVLGGEQYCRWAGVGARLGLWP